MAERNESQRDSERDSRLRLLVQEMLLSDEAFDAHLLAGTSADGCHRELAVLEPWLPDVIAIAMDDPWKLSRDEIDAIIGYIAGIRLLRGWIKALKELPEPWARAILAFSN